MDKRKLSLFAKIFGKRYFIKVINEGIKKDEIIIHGRKFYIHEESVLFNQDRKEVN